MPRARDPLDRTLSTLLCEQATLRFGPSTPESESRLRAVAFELQACIRQLRSHQAYQNPLEREAERDRSPGWR